MNFLTKTPTKMKKRNVIIFFRKSVNIVYFTKKIDLPSSRKSENPQKNENRTNFKYKIFSKYIGMSGILLTYSFITTSNK